MLMQSMTDQAQQSSGLIAATVLATESSASTVQSAVLSANQSGLGKFEFLAKKINIAFSTTGNSVGTNGLNTLDSFKMELGRYIAEIRILKDTSHVLKFWIDREKVYHTLALLAEDIVSAPASEAYCERVFSVCGDLCSGKRNRMSVNLEKRVFMKMNFNYLLKLDKLEF